MKQQHLGVAVLCGQLLLRGRSESLGFGGEESRLFVHNTISYGLLLLLLLSLDPERLGFCDASECCAQSAQLTIEISNTDSSTDCVVREVESGNGVEAAFSCGMRFAEAKHIQSGFALNLSVRGT
jgi:hypothetical protein